MLRSLGAYGTVETEKPMYNISRIEPKGAAIVAKSHISAGATVLRDDPFEAVLDSDSASKLSHWSFKPSKTLQRCVGCKFAWYANRKEQKLAWVNGHKEECRALQNQGDKLPGQSVRLMARILWKRARLKDGASFDAVNNLMSHWVDLSDKQKIMYANAAHATRLYMDPEEGTKGLPSSGEIAQLISMLACNSHTICDDEERPVGLGLYSLGALVNHSSSPSAVQVFLGNQIHFRALHSIAPGEEVTIAYIELGQTREEQRAELLGRYHFDMNQGDRKTQEEPLDQKNGGSTLHPSLCRIWQHAPFHMNPADYALTAVCTGEGTQNEGSGFFIQEPIEDAAVCPVGSFPSDNDEWQLEDPPSNSPTGDSSSRIGNNDLATDNQKKSDQQTPVIVNCWGPVFWKDGVICWERIHHLADIGLAWYGATGKANKAHRIQEPYCLEDLNQALGTAALHASKRIAGNMRVEFGPLHVLRARLNEVRFRIAQQTDQWEEALQCGIELQPFYELVYPQAYPLRGLHEAAVAKIASLLQQPTIALQSAQKAFKVLVQMRPENACLADLLGIQRDASNAK